MRQLREAIRQKRTKLLKIMAIMHLPPAHASMKIKPSSRLKHRIYPTWPTLTFYLPKTPMKEKHFAMIEEIKEKFKQGLLAIPKSAF